MTKPGSFLGRGYDDICGHPFGYAWHKERDEIREHITRGDKVERWTSILALEARVTKIQIRIHRYRPTLRQRQEMTRALITGHIATTATYLTDDERDYIIFKLEGSNDPIAAQIIGKLRG